MSTASHEAMRTKTAPARASLTLKKGPTLEVPEDGFDDDETPLALLQQKPSFRKNTSRKRTAYSHVNTELTYGGLPSDIGDGSMHALRTGDGYDNYPPAYAPLPLPYPSVPPHYPHMPYPAMPYQGMMPGVLMPPYGMPYPGMYHPMMPYATPGGRAEAEKQQSSDGWNNSGWNRGSVRTSRGSSSKLNQQSGDSKSSSAPKTTIMLRNLPEGFLRDDITSLLDRQGFETKYDFVYVPMNFRKDVHFGYAFVNFVSHVTAQNCRSKMEGFKDWGVETEKVLEVSWSDMHQGIEAHIHRYRNSPVMHANVNDKYKPALLKDGERISFPPPTKNVRPPRVRRSHPSEQDRENADGDDNPDSD